MVSLLDLKRRYADVPTDAGEVRMWAVSVVGITHLVSAFPLAKKLMNGSATDEDFDVPALLNLAPDFVAELIAAGADMPGDPAYVKAASEASIGDQAALVAGVLEASLPKGAAPFREALAKIGAALNSGTKAPASV